MKRLFLGGILLGGLALLAGCPIYPSGSPTACGECCEDSDCSSGYQCSQSQQCVPQGTGSYDASASSGSSSGSGSSGSSISDLCGACPLGSVCTLANGVLECLPPDYFGDDASEILYGEDGGSAPADAAAHDAAPDASPPPPKKCNANSDCADAGSGTCLDGLCAPAAEVCSASFPCIGDTVCVGGACLPPCSSGQTNTCPTGYSCDFDLGACSLGAGACSTSSDCAGGATCVETRCVAPAGDGGVCPGGLLAVNGGCIPDELAGSNCQTNPGLCGGR